MLHFDSNATQLLQDTQFTIFERFAQVTRLYRETLSIPYTFTEAAIESDRTGIAPAEKLADLVLSYPDHLQPSDDVWEASMKATSDLGDFEILCVDSHNSVKINAVASF